MRDAMKMGWLKPESDRFLHLDALRFVASATIVVFHYAEWWDHGARPAPSITGLAHAVDIFFIVSGIVLADLYGRAEHGYLNFLRRRLARLAPLHYAVFAGLLVVYFAAARSGFVLGHPEANDPRCILPNLTFTHAFGVCSSLTYNGPSWSISAEMGMYALFPLLARVGRSRWGIVAVAAVLVGLTLIASGPAWTGWSFNFGVARALPPFLFGIALAGNRPALRRIPAPQILFWLVTPLFLWVGWNSQGWAPYALAYIVPAVALAADERPADYMRPLAGLGALTYSSYMLHVPVAMVLLTVGARHFGHLRGASMNAAVVLVGLALVPISLLSLISFERPMRRWIAGPSSRSARQREADQLAP